MEEIDLKEVLELFWNKKVPIILLVLIFALAGFIYTIKFVTPKYTSSTTIVLASSGSNKTTNTITATDVTMNSKLVSTYSELIKSKNVLRQVISNLGKDLEEEELKKCIKVSARGDTEVIEIAVTNEDTKVAAEVANEIADVFIEKVKEIYNIENVQVVDEAEETDIPSNVNHKKDIVLFAIVGFIIGVGYVLLENLLDTSVKNPEDIEKEFGVPVLAYVPKIDGIGSRRGGRR